MIQGTGRTGGAVKVGVRTGDGEGSKWTLQTERYTPRYVYTVKR